VSLALDVLEGSAATLVLEGDADVVDAALESDTGQVVASTQANTKIEPYVWGPRELAEVIAGWLATGPSADERFDFVTDGSLGPAAISRLAPALRRSAEGSLTAADRTYLTSLELDADNPALARVSLRSRLPDGRTLLKHAAMRVMELRERTVAVTVEEARDLVWRLFGETIIGSGEAQSTHRRLDREQIAEITGVTTQAIDAAEPWSPGLEQTYREVLAAAEPDPAWTLLDLFAAERPAVLSLVTAQEPENSHPIPKPATSLLDRRDDVLLQGAAGTGKTTTLTQLRAEALARGLLPIHLRIASYVPGSLERLMRRALEVVTERSLTPGVVAQLLARREVIVLIDGVGELVSGQREAVLEDLSLLMGRGAEARFLLAARDPAPFGRLRLTGFTLSGLERDRRRQIANALTENGGSLVEEIEARLAGLVDNPLLFTMALGLYARGIRADTRAELFEAFTTGLQQREEGTALGAGARAALEACCYDLRGEGRYSADRWWWLDTVASFRGERVERGVLRADGPSAEELVEQMRRCGILQPVGNGADLGLLHDLFCDWLAAEAIRRGHRNLPDEVGESLEEAVVFLAEQGALDDTQLIAVSGNVVAAGRAADVLPAGTFDVDLAQRIWEGLPRSVRARCPRSA
jgi:hypothetical protein